jgi:hypothetical protein
MPERREINDGKASMGKTYLARLRRTAVNDNRAGVVGSAMGKGSLRSRNEFLRDGAAFREDSENSTHICWLPTPLNYSTNKPKK